MIEGRLPAYPATVGEVDAERRRDRLLLDTLSRLADDQASEHGLDIETPRRPAPVVRAVLREAIDSGIDLVVIVRPRGLRLSVPRPGHTRLGPNTNVVLPEKSKNVGRGVIRTTGGSGGGPPFLRAVLSARRWSVADRGPSR
jgi:hypothetical protein